MTHLEGGVSRCRPDASPTFDQAIALFQSGHLAEAEGIVRSLLAYEPKHAQAMHLMGVLLSRQGKHTDGLHFIDAALLIERESASIYNSRANVLVALKRFDEALANFRRAIALNPQYAVAFGNLGNAYQQLGRFDDAIASYDKAIALDPDDAEAFHNRGRALQDLNRLVEAVSSYEKAIALRRDYAEAFSNRGTALQGLGRHFEAVTSYNRAIALKSDFPEALCSRGSVFQELKRFEEALASYDRAIALKPDFADAFNNRGALLRELKRLDEALINCDRAIALKPDFADAFNNRGLVLGEMRRSDESLASYDRAIALKPDHADALNNRGNTLKDLNRLDEALASYDKTVALKPDYAEAVNNRGVVFQELRRFNEALASYDNAIALKPDYAEAINNRGVALHKLKKFDEALASFDKAVALKADYADGYRNRAFCRLLLGRYKEGWADYEGRWEATDFPSERPATKLRTWQGEDLSGRHLLVFAEQGLGDTVQFVRYLSLLAERQCKITFLAPAKLARLLRLSIQPVEIVSTLNDVRGIDFQVALMSLPHLFNTELSSIPNKVPYLRAEEELEAHWQSRIGTDGFKIGIAWQGNPQGKIDEGRSIPLKEFVPLSRLSGVRLISLQKHVGLDQLASLPNDIEIESLGDAFDDGPDAFIDTAAVMNSLDLIITSDTAIAHLAGALSRPTWVALKHVPDWRWLLDCADSPWYPTLRLFRQPQRDDWSSVFVKIERELRSLTSKVA
jgi:tetratricopeptide (TPR) repeat protein